MKKPLVMLASAIIAVTVIIVALIFSGAYRIPSVPVDVLGAVYSIVHWVGWVGALYIALVTSVYIIVKRKYPKRVRTTVSIHVVGNLLAVLLVSIHFAHQVTRPAAFYPDLGTGIVLYASVILLVATGMIMISGIGKRFVKQVRLLHPASALTFYLAIVLHIMHGVGIV